MHNDRHDDTTERIERGIAAADRFLVLLVGLAVAGGLVIVGVATLAGMLG